MSEEWESNQQQGIVEYNEEWGSVESLLIAAIVATGS